MSKIHSIPQQLWGALGLVTNHLDFAQATTGNWNPRLTHAIKLVKEYQSCFGANGKVSQRGEIPQCWNPYTIFTPHRKVGEKELRYDQPLLPFEEVVKEEQQ